MKLDKQPTSKKEKQYKLSLEKARSVMAEQRPTARATAAFNRRPYYLTYKEKLEAMRD